jgi:hypothetical protein
MAACVGGAAAVLLCFGAGGTAYGQACPPGGEPPPIAGLGSGPGSTDRTFGYSGAPNFNTIDSSMNNLLQKIGITLPRRIITSPGAIRAIAVQRVGANADKFIVAGDFEYRVPFTNTVYRNIMRLNANGTIDTTFTPPLTPVPVVNALAVDSLDRIVVGCETAPRLFRLLSGGGLDGTFTPPAPTAAVLAVEVEPLTNNVYVGLNGGTIGGRTNLARLLSNGMPDTSGFWGPQTAPAQQVLVNGPVRAIKFADRLYGPSGPGIVVGGAFNLAQGGPYPPPLSFECLNVALFPTNGDFVSSSGFFTTFFKGFDGPINAIAVSVSPANVSEIFVGGEFGNCVTFASPPERCSSACCQILFFCRTGYCLQS